MTALETFNTTLASTLHSKKLEFITYHLSTGTEKWLLKWISTYQIHLSLLHSNAMESFQKKYYIPSISKQL